MEKNTPIKNGLLNASKSDLIITYIGATLMVLSGIANTISWVMGREEFVLAGKFMGTGILTVVAFYFLFWKKYPDYSQKN